MDDEALLHVMMHITVYSVYSVHACRRTEDVLYVGWWMFAHLEAKGAGAVVGARDITHTCAVVLTGSRQTGGALGHQIQICWTWNTPHKMKYKCVDEKGNKKGMDVNVKQTWPYLLVKQYIVYVHVITRKKKTFTKIYELVSSTETVIFAVFMCCYSMHLLFWISFYFPVFI